MDREAEVRGGWMSGQSGAVLLPSHDFQEKPHLTQLMNMTPRLCSASLSHCPPLLPCRVLPKSLRSRVRKDPFFVS